MSKTIDERIVRMRFDNADFEQRVASTRKSLNDLNESLFLKTDRANLDAVSRDIANIGKTDLSGLSGGIDAISVKFSALASISNTIWTRITNAAIDAGHKIGSVLSAPLNQIATGGKARAKNIEQAKFQLEGLGVAWSEIEKDIDYGVKDTAYGLDSAARVAAQLVASQVKLGDEMQSTLRGISGVAAMTNSTYDDIGSIFTTVAGNGRLMGMQLTQLAGRGLNAAAALGKYLGKSEAEIREMTSKGEIDFKTFAKAMNETFGDHAKEANKTFDGALSNIKAALSRLGADVATSGFESLRQIMVETIPVINSLKKSAEPFIGAVSSALEDFAKVAVFAVDAVKDLFFELDGDGKVVGGPLLSFFTDLAERIKIFTWKAYAAGRKFVDHGGLVDVLVGLKNVVSFLVTPLKILKQTFLNVFGTGNKTALDSARSFRKFSEGLGYTVEAYSGLTKIFGTGFRILKGGIDLIKQAAAALKPFVVQIKDTVVSMLEFIGMPEIHENPLLKVFSQETLDRISNSFPKAINNLTDLFTGLFNILKAVGGIFVDIFAKAFEKIANFDLAGQFSSLFDSLSQNEHLVKFADNVKKVFAKLNDGISKGGIFELISKVGDVLINFFKKATSEGKLFKASFIIGLFALVNAIKALKNSLFALNPLKTIKFISNNFKIFAKALSIKEIVKGILALSAALFILSMVDANNLQKVMLVMAKMFTWIAGVVTGLSVLQKKEIAGDITKLAISLIPLASAVLILSLALKLISTIPAESIREYCLILVSVLTWLAMTAVVMSSLSKGLIKGSSILTKLASSVLILSIALKVLSSIDPAILSSSLKVLLKLMTKLAVLTTVMSLLTDKMAGGSRLLISFAAAIWILVSAIKKMSDIDIDSRNSAIAQIVTLMVEFSLIVTLMSRVAPELSKGAGLVLAFSISMAILAKAVQMIAEIPFDDAWKASLIISALMVTLGLIAGALGKNVEKLTSGAFTIIAFTAGILILVKALSNIVELMNSGGNIYGAIEILGILVAGLLGITLGLSSIRAINPSVIFALLASVIAIKAVGHALAETATLPWDGLLTAALTIGGTLIAVTAAISGISGKTMNPVTLISLLAVAILIKSVGHSLAETATLPWKGILAAAVAISGTLLAVSGAVAIMSGNPMEIAGLLSMLAVAVAIKAIGSALSELAKYDWKELGTAVLALLATLAVMMGATALAGAGFEIFLLGAVTILALSAAFIALGVATKVLAFGMKALEILDITKIATGLMTLAGIGSILGLLSPLLLASVVSITAFGGALSILSVSLVLLGVGAVAFAAGIATIMMAVEVFGNGCLDIIERAKEIFGIHSPSTVMKEIGSFVVQGMINGITEGIPNLLNKFGEMCSQAIEKVKEKTNEMITAGGNLVDGLIKGISNKAGMLKDAAINMARSFKDKFCEFFGIHSPSTVMAEMGGYLNAGLVKGIDDSKEGVKNTVFSLGNSIIDALSRTTDEDFDISPTITPVLDLSNIESGAGNIDSLLGSKSVTLDNVSKITGGTLNGSTLNVNNDYSSIIDKMNSLDQSISALGDKFNNLKVYMNGRTLVGEIAGDMDKALGNRTVRNNRATGAPARKLAYR